MYRMSGLVHQYNCILVLIMLITHVVLGEMFVCNNYKNCQTVVWIMLSYVFIPYAIIVVLCCDD